MNAEQYLKCILRDDIKIGVLSLRAWYEIMDGYARQKIEEALKPTAQQPQGATEQTAPHAATVVCNGLPKFINRRLQ